MTIKEFIEAAIEGGFSFFPESENVSKEKITRIDTDSALDDGKFYVHFFDHESDMFRFNTFEMILNPKAWKAVGKVKG